MPQCQNFAFKKTESEGNLSPLENHANWVSVRAFPLGVPLPMCANAACPELQEPKPWGLVLSGWQPGSLNSQRGECLNPWCVERPTLPALGGLLEVGMGPLSPASPSQAMPLEGSALCQHPTHCRCPIMKQKISTEKVYSADGSTAVHLAIRNHRWRSSVQKEKMHTPMTWRQRWPLRPPTHHNVPRSDLLLRL